MADILVVDGDATYRMAIAQTLTDVGHQVQQAGDGAEGLALCRRMLPALVITAIVMPEKDGFELIRELSRDIPHLPILAIAGQVNASLYSRVATTFGAAAALRKPFSADELLRAVATLLDGGANRKRKDSRRSHLKRSGHRMAGCL